MSGVSLKGGAILLLRGTTTAASIAVAVSITVVITIATIISTSTISTAAAVHSTMGSSMRGVSTDLKSCAVAVAVVVVVGVSGGSARR